MVEQYILSQQKTNILQILRDADVKKHYSLNISFVELFDNDANLGNNILKNPEEALDELDQWILSVEDTLIEECKDENLIHKLFVHARIYGLIACPELHRNVFPKNDDLDLFLQVTGTVVRVTASKMLEYQRPYMCTKCKYVEMVEAVYDQKYIIIPPKKCLNPEKCPGTNLISTGDLNADNCKDYQEVKIQEQASKLGVGTMPCSMWVTLEDDLVDACKPGDDVTICGIVKRRWGPLIPGKKIEVELVIKANHIQVNNDQTSPSLITREVREQFVSFWEKYKSRPLEGRDLILKSFCPKLYGMYIVKLAVAVVLAGGSRCTQGNEMGIQIRSEPHILLVGDPGTGKSQLLRYAAKVIPRSVLTTGVGTTSAGLTVAAVMEDGHWQLEGGALVLADGGICCIDEFNSMKPHDRLSIHEAMEQQTISVAKASMVCKLRTRCSILAATNPKGGHLDSSQPLSLNLTLPSPLLSRFDIVLMLKDCYDTEWDNLIADYILSGKGVNAVKIDASLWNLETLQQYFTIIKSINPVLTPSANKIFSSYYQAQRRAISRNKARTTVRLLDSLIRLSQAHARLMFHTEVHVMDALFAVVLIENSMQGECAVLSFNTVDVQAPFLTAPMENYAQLVNSMLSRLGLHSILKNEVALLNSGYEYNPEVFGHEEETIVSDKTNETFGESSLTTANLECSSTISDVTLTVIESTNEENKNQEINTDIVDVNKTVIEINENPQKSQKIKHNFEQSKSKVVNEDVKKIESNEIEENPTDHSNLRDINDDDSFIRKKKRKNLKPHKYSKESKAAKKTSNLNDFQMMNLIRSVNDEFDASILNFMDDVDNEKKKSPNEEMPSHFVSNVDVKDKEELSISTSKMAVEDEYQNSSTDLVNNDNIEVANKQGITESSDFKSVSEKTVEKLSQTAGVRQFLRTFSFKPTNLPNCEKSKVEDTSLNGQNCDDLVTVNANLSQTPTSQILFKGLDQDYDSLNFEF